VKIDLVPIDYRRVDENNVVPSDPLAFEMALHFAEKELAAPFNLDNVGKTWMVAKLDADGTPREAIGLVAINELKVYDVPVYRVVGPHAMQAHKRIADRLNAFFADRGYRGRDVMIFFPSDNAPEQRCANWEHAMQLFGAFPADRYLVKIR
jgi:hypothetical protein